jgi:sugar phosphate isomerase/epimerase
MAGSPASQLAFMSSVCPSAKLEELIGHGREHGYSAIEFRPEWKHGHGIELEASAGRREEMAAVLRDSGLAACCLSPGCRFTQAEPAEREEALEKLRRYVELAAAVGIPLLRVFADPIPHGGRRARAETIRIEAEYFARAAESAAQAGVRLALETHMSCRAVDVGEILYQAGYPRALWVNWHLEHCLVHGEDVDEAYRHVKGRVAHVHFAVDEKNSLLPALQRQYELLIDEGYPGFFSVEVINPAESQAVLARHAELWPQIVGQAG